MSYGNKEQVTTRDIHALIRGRFEDTRRYALASEVGNRTGGASRYLDFLVAYCYASEGWALEGIEVKMSKSDFRKEFEDTGKHNVFYPSLDYYSIAAPKSIIDMELVPPKWGVYEVTRQRVASNADETAPFLSCKRKPLMLHDEKLPTVDRAFAICAMRALYKQSPSKKRMDAEHQRGVEEGKKIAMLHRQPDADRQHYEWVERENERLRVALEASEELKGLTRWQCGRFAQNVKLIASVDVKDLEYTIGQLDLYLKPLRELLKEAGEE